MKNAFLALLARSPAHGYELKQLLDERFGATLALNAGQVYTTLQRLERDGLVEGVDIPEDTRGKRVYAITAAGREALEAWFEETSTPTRLRDELYLKLALADATGIVETMTLIDRQRRAALQALRALDERSSGDSTIASLLAEGAAFHLEADLRWLDLCQTRLQEGSNGHRDPS